MFAFSFDLLGIRCRLAFPTACGVRVSCLEAFLAASFCVMEMGSQSDSSAAAFAMIYVHALIFPEFRRH